MCYYFRDILLLEVGFLCIIVSPFRGTSYFIPRPYDHINLMLVRWLLFRMMFASGVVRLNSTKKINITEYQFYYNLI